MSQGYMKRPGNSRRAAPARERPRPRKALGRRPRAWRVAGGEGPGRARGEGRPGRAGGSGERFGGERDGRGRGGGRRRRVHFLTRPRPLLSSPTGRRELRKKVSREKHGRRAEKPANISSRENSYYLPAHRRDDGNFSIILDFLVKITRRRSGKDAGLGKTGRQNVDYFFNLT